MKVRVIERGDAFCRMGDEQHEIGILLSGLARVFTSSGEGDEVTLDFVFPVELIAAVDAATAQMPSQVTIEMLETSSVAVWPFEIRNEAARRHPDWIDFNRIELENLFRRKNRYARALQTQDAATRYRDWMDQHPGAANRIPQYLIASYLGITPQSLSRIRRQSEAQETSSVEHGATKEVS
jgi:CRP-like cAMP-binding protein